MVFTDNFARHLGFPVFSYNSPEVWLLTPNVAHYSQGWRLWWSAKEKAADFAEHAPEYYAQAKEKSAETYQQACQTAGDVSDYVMETKDYVTGDVKKRDNGKWWRWAVWGDKAREEEEAKRYGTVRTNFVLTISPLTEGRDWMSLVALCG